MLANSDLIPGVYNFCDAWCERCQLMERCRRFQMQQAAGRQDAADANAALTDQLTEALNQTKLYIKKLPPQNAPPCRHTTEKQPTAALSSTYLKQTGEWLGAERQWLERAATEQWRAVGLGLRTEEQARLQLSALKNAFDSIRWYHILLPVKTIAALRGLDVPIADEQLQLYYIGKAKLVLVSIDRSLAAWQTILHYFPDDVDDMLDMLALLMQLRQQIETLFPDACAFKRPGLD